ncbi:hypothetical protein DFH28DRAFT_946170 [Melampsora americana]|nr:hypothetical protein DFH28DRAFT_946170 [Melampsora americana]
MSLCISQLLCFFSFESAVATLLYQEAKACILCFDVRYLRTQTGSVRKGIFKTEAFIFISRLRRVYWCFTEDGQGIQQKYSMRHGIDKRNQGESSAIIWFQW